MQLNDPRLNRKQDAFSKLVFELSKLPGVGEKTATRLAYFILKQEKSYSEALAEAVLNAKTKTRLCSDCYTFSDQSPCGICSDPQRDATTLCVVERPSDILSIEQTSVFRGRYHALHGVISPLDGIGPDDLKIQELLERINRENSEVRELIIGTNPSVEGDATALYLSKILKPFGLRTTKLAHGLPVGGRLEFTDRQTIGKALENRVEIA